MSKVKTYLRNLLLFPELIARKGQNIQRDGRAFEGIVKLIESPVMRLSVAYVFQQVKQVITSSLVRVKIQDFAIKSSELCSYHNN